MDNGYKYITVVEDGSGSFLAPTKSSYKIIEHSGSSRNGECLIEPLGGVSPADAAQLFFFANDHHRLVYVREYLPEFKYEKFVDKSHFRDPFIQARLEKEDEEYRNRLEPNF